MDFGLDDHYVPDPHNAHIDTSDFLQELEQLTAGRDARELDQADLAASIHRLIMAKVSSPPDEPDEDALVCRYLTPAKFLWFVHGFLLHIGSARDFEDQRDCALPADYLSAVSQFFQLKSVVPLAWNAHCDQMRTRWLVSCWTALDNHSDDYLLWHRYAGGPLGVAVTLKCGVLREAIKRSIESDDGVGVFTCGKVSYIGRLRLPPFNKRRIFRNEREIRFACTTDRLASFPVDLSDQKAGMGLRFSPDAPPHHIAAAKEIWCKTGGPARFHISGD